MTYLIIKETTFFSGDKCYTVHDKTESDQVAIRKEKGYNMASNDNERFVISFVDNVITDPEVIKKDENFNYSQLTLPFPEVQ